MRGQSPRATAIEAALFAAVPGFSWCGRCAIPTRTITETEAAAVVALLATFGDSALDALDGSSWFMEMYARQRRLGTCSCPQRVPRSGFFLYRLWTVEGRLLYVGVSTHLSARLRNHRRKLGDLFDHATWEEHPDAETVLDAERKAIADELPALNKASVG
jgi:hypothetical protein